MLRHVFSLSQSTSELISHLVREGEGESLLKYVNYCLTSIQIGVFQQVLYLFHTFPRLIAQGKNPTSLLLKKSELYI